MGREPEVLIGRRPTLTSLVWIKELSMKNLFLRFVKDDSGATAIEYGLIAAGISVAIIAVVNGLGSKLNTSFSSISTQLR
jgi:pilus assembly protein Flp/PilA